MWRSLVTVLIAAVLGSLASTAGFIWLEGGTGGLDPTRFTLAITGTTMFFTVPGAIMLLGAQAILSERGLGRAHRDALVALLGAVMGAAILAPFSLPMSGRGAVYGLATAVALICLQRLIGVERKPST